MLTAIAFIAGAGVSTVVASWLIWRAARRSPAWSIMAGILLALLGIVCVVLIAWLVTRALYGNLGERRPPGGPPRYACAAVAVRPGFRQTAARWRAT